MMRVSVFIKFIRCGFLGLCCVRLFIGKARWKMVFLFVPIHMRQWGKIKVYQEPGGLLLMTINAGSRAPS